MAMAVTLLDADGTFEGTLTGKDAQVLGRFKGDIEVTGRLAIGEGAHVEAQVIADTVEIAGELRGDVHARSVVLTERARVDGSIDARLLAVRDGARLNGAVQAGQAAAAGAPPAPGHAVFVSPVTVK